MYIIKDVTLDFIKSDCDHLILLKSYSNRRVGIIRHKSSFLTTSVSPAVPLKKPQNLYTPQSSQGLREERKRKDVIGKTTST